MSESFNACLLARQKGMTLLEMIMVIAIMALLATLVFTSPQFLTRSSAVNWSAKRDFSNWYQQVQRNALYTSTPGRVCLIGQKMVVQYYRPDNGWQENDIFYRPPTGVRMSWLHQDCSPEFTHNADDYISQITFHLTT